MKKIETGITVLLSFMFILTAQSLPSSFDLRDYNGNNYVTAVKHQQGGTCWTHGAMASIESNLLMLGEWDWYLEGGEPDLAEYHLDWWNGFNQFNNDDILPDTGEGLEVHMGGDYLVTAAYTTRGEGAVSNSEAQSYDTPPDRYNDNLGAWYRKYFPYDIEWYTMDENLNGIDLIKEKIMTHGAIGTCMMFDSGFIQDYIHYQPPSDDQEPNHAVAIIGWDDDKITQAPEGPGAWLVKNSWGTGWGIGGYFWISYYDKHSCKHPEMGAISFQNVKAYDHTTSRDHVAYHDYHGWRDTMKDCKEAFNVFDMGRWLYINNISFYTAEDHVDYTVTLYDTFQDGELGDMLKTVSGHIDHKGFHAIDFPYSFGEYDPGYVYVYLNLSKGGQPYDRTSEIPVLLGSKNKALVRSTASRGESFYRTGENWVDMQDYTGDDYPGTSNFCIKIMYSTPCAVEDDRIPDSTGLFQNYPNPFNPETVISFILKENAKIRLTIYNMKGETVKNILDGEHRSGFHRVNFNAGELTSGIYFYALDVNGIRADFRKMVLIR